MDFKRMFGLKARRAPAHELGLPKWARLADEHSPRVGVLIKADMNEAMREWFDLLGNPKPDQYWIEVAYQCAKMDLQMAIDGTEFDPRISGKPAEFHFSRANKWALAKHPPGRGIEAASRGLEARAHYKKVRGKLPL